MKAAALALALAGALLAGACAGCTLGPDPLSKDPELRAARARLGNVSAPVRLAVTPAELDYPKAHDLEEDPGVYPAEIDVTAVQQALAGAIGEYTPFRDPILLDVREREAAFRKAEQAGADLLLFPRFSRFEDYFAGRNWSWPLNVALWLHFWIPAWWVPDEDYGARADLALEFFSVASERLAASAISLEELAAELGAIRCEHVLIVVDAAFAGGGGRRFRPDGPRGASVDDARLAHLTAGTKDLAIFLASGAGEPAIDLEEAGRGLFTYLFLEGASGAAANPGEAVTLADLATHAARLVPAQAGLEGVSQNPRLFRAGRRVAPGSRDEGRGLPDQGRVAEVAGQMASLGTGHWRPGSRPRIDPREPGLTGQCQMAVPSAQ